MASPPQNILTTYRKTSLEWDIKRQRVSTDKDSEIMNDPKYPLELLLRVTTVSLKTNRIVSELPALQIN